MRLALCRVARHALAAFAGIVAAAGSSALPGAALAVPAVCTILGIDSARLAVCSLSLPNGGGSLVEIVNDTGRIIQCSGNVDPATGKPNGDCAAIGTLPSPGLGFSLEAANQQQVVLIANATAVIQCTAAMTASGKPAGSCAQIGTLTADVRVSVAASDDREIVYLTADGTLTECTAFIDGGGAPAGQCARIGGLPAASTDSGWSFFIGGSVIFFVDMPTGAVHGCIPLQSPTGVPTGVCA